VVSEGGAVFTVERLDDALARGAPILGEVVGFHMNSDAVDAVLPNHERQAQCMQAALAKAGMRAADIDLVSTHATSTPQGDIQECLAIRSVFPQESCPQTRVNNTKSYIGHAMGAAGALELAGNLPSFSDGRIHPTINVDELDPECALPQLVIGSAEQRPAVNTILNNSFGMLGINSCVIVKKFAEQ
jgi:3-oxoacyl-[acyl-carrier-protein] synthase II